MKERVFYGVDYKIGDKRNIAMFDNPKEAYQFYIEGIEVLKPKELRTTNNDTIRICTELIELTEKLYV